MDTVQNTTSKKTDLRIVDDSYVKPSEKRKLGGHGTVSAVSTGLFWHELHTGGPYVLMPFQNGLSAVPATLWSMPHEHSVTMIFWISALGATAATGLASGWKMTETAWTMIRRKIRRR